MHISKVELENIKSHVSSAFEFAPGTTAITGPNGAGKTTIIEAIAWVLFDLLEYKKDDFLRRGTKKGSARVTFVSSLDEREYTVFRDTGTAYNVTDPRLGAKLADKREEVYRFLWQHLGLEPGTDLKSLFRQAIGVPQGTLTAIFLEGATERKIAFDRLLRVEEYRQAAEKLRETNRYIDTSVVTAREAIARAEGELLRFETVEKEHKSYIEENARAAEELKILESSLKTLRERTSVLDQKERELIKATAEVESTRNAFDKAEIVTGQLRSAVERAEKAWEVVDRVRADAKLHLSLQDRSKELERERIERDKLASEVAKIDASIASVERERTRLRELTDKISAAREQVKSLSAAVVEQQELEQRLLSLRERVAAAASNTSQISGIDAQLARLRESFRSNQERLKNSQEGSVLAAELPVLEKRNDEVLHHLADLRAALERDKKFQAEIKGGFCPVLTQKCLNIGEEQTLEAFLSGQFTQVTAHIQELEQERQVIGTSLAAARSAAQSAAAVEEYRRRSEELTEEGQRLKKEKELLEEQLKSIEDLRAEIQIAEAKLSELDDPRSTVRSLQREIESEDKIRVQYRSVESNSERLTAERNELIESLEKYISLDKDLADNTRRRELTSHNYLLFVANEAESTALDNRRSELASAEKEQQGFVASLNKAEAELKHIQAGYDADAHAAARADLKRDEAEYQTLSANLRAAQRREAELARELERFAEVRQAMLGQLQERERLQALAEATTLIRDTLKDAAPRVARNYVFHVSMEANQLFREITGNGERTLKSAEDYSVLLEEDGYRTSVH